jgi:pyruvate/2-oxoglutarate dehydrogenase complex dihydrolipoamide dehydrogenase (E3) component
MTNADIVTLTELPRHLAIIAGSYIGLEFAQMFRRFGAEVTVVEQSVRLIPREDECISQEVRSILENEGIRFHVGSDCVRFAAHPDGAVVSVARHGNTDDIVATHVLLAVGRRPNTDDLGLEVAGIATDAHGFIQVDDQLRANVPGIWALGGCNGRGAFTHSAWNDYEIVSANELDGESLAPLPIAFPLTHSTSIRPSAASARVP